MILLPDVPLVKWHLNITSEVDACYIGALKKKKQAEKKVQKLEEHHEKVASLYLTDQN